ncbi:MAG: type II toxin-antitoxin system MqsA family antitoxin [Gallionella sp.]|nr:type II toxin-antitoxin system MqsA family antitoxin [Gallionella sp.]MDD4958996.1 type II toxin-antitoxin system MqsA family antitoxin [Gallionella sp.]
MPILSETELLAHDAPRGTGLSVSIHPAQGRQLEQGGVASRTGRVIESPIAQARVMSQLSQAQFAGLLGVSVRTLQEWEQGRRQPSGAARTLLRVAEKHPEVLRELIAEPSDFPHLNVCVISGGNQRTHF